MSGDVSVEERRELCGYWSHADGFLFAVAGAQLDYAHVSLNDGAGWYDDGEYAWPTVARLVGESRRPGRYRIESTDGSPVVVV